ncbi:DUF5133 domain-containing protein [Streptomyces sp. NPDC058657]|uniref:DUF5133 domain-containing protein n=1 Tax=unclassified Streptomyces TaxID=2593676 RepID=UPI0036480BAF
MLIPNVQVLRDVRARYTAARQAYQESPGESTRLALVNAAYTLCVLTATTQVPQALAAADLLLRTASVAAPPRAMARRADREALAA